MLEPDLETVYVVSKAMIRVQCLRSKSANFLVRAVHSGWSYSYI